MPPTPRNWKSIAEALNLGIPPQDLEKIAPVLDAMDAAFRPLVETIPLDTEPAITFACRPEESS